MSDKSIRIGLYFLERSDTPQPDEWTKCVVAAATESQARELANQQSGTEGYVWSDGRLVASTVLGEAAEGIDGVICFTKERDA